MGRKPRQQPEYPFHSTHLEKNKQTQIVSLGVVPATESKTVALVAVTDSGMRIYLSCGSRCDDASIVHDVAVSFVCGVRDVALGPFLSSAPLCLLLGQIDCCEPCFGFSQVCCHQVFDN